MAKVYKELPRFPKISEQGYETLFKGSYRKVIRKMVKEVTKEMVEIIKERNK